MVKEEPISGYTPGMRMGKPPPHQAHDRSQLCPIQALFPSRLGHRGWKDGVLSVESNLEASPCRKQEPGAEKVSGNLLLPLSPPCF